MWAGRAVLHVVCVCVGGVIVWGRAANGDSGTEWSHPHAPCMRPTLLRTPPYLEPPPYLPAIELSLGSYLLATACYCPLHTSSCPLLLPPAHILMPHATAPCTHPHAPCYCPLRTSSCPMLLPPAHILYIPPPAVPLWCMGILHAFTCPAPPDPCYCLQLQAPRMSCPLLLPP